MTNQIALSNPLVFINQNQVITTSNIVADYFGKLHKNVIQKIENLDCSRGFTSANFSAHAENIKAGTVCRDSKYYEMTKDGFIFLVMGFTGKKAALLKEAYINAFNLMAEKLNNPQLHNPRSPTDIEFINDIHDNLSVCFKGSEITQLNALLETIDYLNKECWPHLDALFPRLNPDIKNSFSKKSMTLGLLKQRYKEFHAKSEMIMMGNY